MDQNSPHFFSGRLNVYTYIKKIDYLIKKYPGVRMLAELVEQLLVFHKVR